MTQQYALITGASSGIGKAVAQYLAKENYHLILIARNLKKLEKTKNELAKINHQIDIQIHSIDLSNLEESYRKVTNIINSIEELAVTFNNAGIARYDTSETSLDDFKALMDTNVNGMFAVAKASALKMKKQNSGYIINLSSAAGIRAYPRAGSYAASKFAVVGFSQALMKEMANYKVKVTSICPSAIDTDMTKNFQLDNKEKLKTNDIVKTVDYLLNLGETAIIDHIVIEVRELIKDTTVL